MDPNVLLRRIRAAGDELIREGCHDPDATEDLIQDIRDLDEWITKGGFLPLDWTRTPYGD